MSKISVALAAVALTVASFAFASGSSAKPMGPSGPAMKPIGGGSQYQPKPSFKSGGCPNGWVGCNPNTWGPGKFNGGFAVGIGVGFAQPVASVAVVADTGDCYYVRRKVFVEGVGLVRQRILTCN